MLVIRYTHGEHPIWTVGYYEPETHSRQPMWTPLRDFDNVDGAMQCIRWLNGGADEDEK